ncbi:MAG: zinc ribbon domain-containing protein [Thermodesulfobacteriota bacterium]
MESKDFGEKIKKCPSCAETIKLEALKCRFCGHEFDPSEVDREVRFIQEMEAQGKKKCPTCGEWDVHKAYIEDGSWGDWCPHCKKSTTAHISQTTQQKKKTSIFFTIAICSFIIGLFTPRILASIPLLVATIFGFISFIRGESLKWVGGAIGILSIITLITVQTELNNIGTKLKNISSDTSKSFGKEDVSYLNNLKIEKIDYKIGYSRDHATFAARVKNNGNKIVTQLKANVEVYDKNERVVHSATIHDFGDIFPGSVKEISTFSRVPRDGKSCRIFLTEARVKDIN